MKWTQYQLTLSLLGQEHIETVRYWRNHPQIYRYMEYQTYITPQMQLNWFANINNAYNFYFIIEHSGEQVGLISTAGIDTHYQTANCGIFIWQAAAAGSHVPVFAVLAMLNFDFYLLQLQTTFIKVHKHNQKALKYNRSLGYEPIAQSALPDGDNFFGHYQLTRQRYITYTQQYRQLGKKLYGNNATLQLSATPQGLHVQTLLANLPTEAFNQWNLEIIP